MHINLVHLLEVTDKVLWCPASLHLLYLCCSSLPRYRPVGWYVFLLLGVSVDVFSSVSVAESFHMSLLAVCDAVSCASFSVFRLANGGSFLLCGVTSGNDELYG